jgi:precorrin-6Y C5,15-methyltransferase (decarboxylating)
VSALQLDVVGIGEDGLIGLSESTQRLVLGAEVLVGGRRHFELVPETGALRIPWRSPLASTLDEIAAMAGRRIVVLATGDPLWFGVGRTLCARFGREAVRIHPHVSAFQLACARLGWPLEEVTTVSLHGRPIAALARLLQPGRRLLLLTADGAAAPEIGRLLTSRGFAPSAAFVLGHMGGRRESLWQGTAAELAAATGLPELNLVALELQATSAATVLPLAPGLPDDAFAHDGNITKAEVRAIALAALAPLPGSVLWDVGAGSGSIAIEFLRLEPQARAFAIERRPDRVAALRANALALGVPGLEIIEGTAPAALVSLPDPDRIFLGGGVAEKGLIDYLCERLRPAGRLVAHAISLEGERVLLAFVARHGGQLRRIAIDRAEPRGGRTLWRPLAPVIQLVWERR